jgi:hypothetical protein
MVVPTYVYSYGIYSCAKYSTYSTCMHAVHTLHQYPNRTPARHKGMHAASARSVTNPRKYLIYRQTYVHGHVSEAALITCRRAKEARDVPSLMQTWVWNRIISRESRLIIRKGRLIRGQGQRQFRTHVLVHSTYVWHEANVADVLENHKSPLYPPMRCLV